MKMKYRKLYQMKSITEINTLQCLHEKCITLKAEINILHVSMKMKYRTVYHMKSKTEINTLQCLHENQVQNIVSHEKHNRN